MTQELGTGYWTFWCQEKAEKWGAGDKNRIYKPVGGPLWERRRCLKDEKAWGRGEGQ